MSDDPEMNAIYEGRKNFFQSTSTLNALPHAEFKDFPSRCFFASGIEHPLGNGVLEKQQHQNLTKEEIEHAMRFFQKKKLPFLWWSGNKLLEKYGLEYGGCLKGVFLNVHNHRASKPPPRLQLEPISSASDLKAFCTHICESFYLEPLHLQQLYKTSMAAMKEGLQTHYAAKIEEEVVGGVTLCTASSAGIWNLAIAPEYRLQGFGSCLISYAIEEAKKKGFSSIISILSQGGLAWSIMQKAGFEPTCEFPFYLYNRGY